MIPERIWNEGVPGNNKVPALSIPGRDALEIERRRNNNINLRNEDHRYTIACERIQSLAYETSQNCDDLPEPFVWSAYNNVTNDHSIALAYLITVETLYRALFKSIDKLPYQRFLAVFFPPCDKDKHLRLFQFLVNNPKIDDIMLRSSIISSRLGTEYLIPAEQCKLALLQRYELIKTVQSQNCGLVDVIQIV
jgi:hypothetical protein